MVWEEDRERLDRFVAEHPGVRVVGGPGELLDTRPDGVVLTVPTPGLAAVLGQVVQAGPPCFVNKPAAATRAQLDALDAVAAPAAGRILSTSVLRFAPAFAEAADGLAERAARGEVHAVRATVRHDVGLWATGYNPWQDDPAEGGGTLVTMGIHGVELLVALLGPDVRLAGAARATRAHHGLRSEDTGVLALRWDSGITGTVEVLGVSEVESYTVAAHTARSTETIAIEGGADTLDGLGYRGTIDAFLAMVGGAPSPVPWEQTRAILAVLAAAREAAPPLQPGG
ncbi:Gfo/Idh/MocA family oxidoreductase [Spongiactinospora sp. TRM90649]|uniref:Gfo/Idh/MocA family protein n=1 Tax=Spongiactinospora sp. TRM90649 TaxID=3031114 RepID=UPI0023F9B29B|nr:Gfo/Idh/MocA family oxidoreductase [Spongiactinospora sp. TRM90649]